ncbi:hypothetical protein JCM11251_006705 [Rhodosporidiobolus azoricus]
MQDNPRAKPSRSSLPVEQALLVSAATTLSLAASWGLWYRFGRRVLNVDDLRRSDYSPRRLRGVVLRVPDGDGLRLFHRPFLRPFLKPPPPRSGLSKTTLSIRLAGVDAPEMAHFGHPEQPFAPEARDFLRQLVLGKPVVVELYRKDQYQRVVGHVYIRKFPFFLRRNVSELLVEAGYASVYEEHGAVYGGRLDRLRRLEERARSKRRGMWSLGSHLESPAAFKQRVRNQGSEGSTS